MIVSTKTLRRSQIYPKHIYFWKKKKKKKKNKLRFCMYLEIVYPAKYLLIKV